MYDGYILQPNAFENMLNDEHKETYSDVHFKSTQHLRDQADSTRSLVGKKETYTSTDGLANADPLPPSIMFKMRFNSNKMDRQLNESGEDDEDDHKDFVNVVNLDNQAVDDILQMIESEQNKREGRYVNVKPKEKLKLIPQTNNHVDILNQTPNKIERRLSETSRHSAMIPATDILTKNLLASTGDRDNEWQDYDEIVRKQIEESSKKSGCSVSKQRIMNEFRFIDDKIKLMNQMADNMTSDYDKYGKVLGNIQDLTKQREAIERYQKREEIEEKKKLGFPKNEPVKFYETTKAKEQIDNFIQNVDTPKNLSIQKPQLIDTEFDKDLSTLVKEDEPKVKKLLETVQLDMSATMDSKANTTGNSMYQNVLKDVFEDMDSNDEINSEQIDQILEKSITRRSTNEFREMIPTRDTPPLSSRSSKVPVEKPLTVKVLKVFIRKFSYLASY